MIKRWTQLDRLPKKGPGALWMAAAFSFLALSSCQSILTENGTVDPTALTTTETNDPRTTPIPLDSANRDSSPNPATPVDGRAQISANASSLTVASADEFPVASTDAEIPEIADSTPFLMPETSTPSLATFTVTVTDTPLREVLFALARDANLNIDIYPGIEGKITFNAIDQTLPVILNRIAEYAGLKYKITQESIIIMPDVPYRQNYKVDYIMNNRKFESKMSSATNMASLGGSKSTSGNNSTINLNTQSEIDFWKDILENLNAMLGKAEKDEPQRVILNQSTGVFSIIATNRQHAEVQKFFDQVGRDANRQVFIEAVIVEVKLSDQFQAGVDWNKILSKKERISSQQEMLSGRIVSGSNFSVTVDSKDIPILTGILRNTDLAGTVRMLSEFGNTKVLSNPKLTVMNNQTAVLRVTENTVYFEIEVKPGAAYKDAFGYTTFGPSLTETKIRIAPVGVILQVTPQISDDDVVSLNIRPTVQSISSWKDNPDPHMRPDTIQGSSQQFNYTPPQVPQVQIQEMDSTLRISSGQIAIMGGLIKNSHLKNMDGVPLLGKLPLIGSLFSYRNDLQERKELAIFLRPIVIHDAKDMDQVGSRQLYENRERGINKDWNQLGAGPP